MENTYVAFKTLMSDWNTFNFTTLETVFENVAARGRQSIIRVYVDYPSTDNPPTIQDILPAFLIQGTVVIDNNDGSGVHPDYNNANLIKALVQLIQAMGAKYDGDKRIAVWQTGILGHWGEWHNYPTTDFANKNNQDLILNAFTTSFKKTKLQVRYPNVIGSYVPSQLNMGYYDDSFMEDTYGTDSWMFYNQLSSVNGQDIWKTQMMGGELYPPYQQCAFSGSSCGLDWQQCVDLIKPAWMWNNWAFDQGYSGAQYDNAINAAAGLGYQIHLQSLQVSEVCKNTTKGCTTTASVSVINNGSSRFYLPIYVQLSVGNVKNSVSLDTTPGQQKSLNVTLTGNTAKGQTLTLSLISGSVLSPIKWATSQANSAGSLTFTISSAPLTNSTTSTTATPSQAQISTSILGAEPVVQPANAAASVVQNTMFIAMSLAAFLL